MGGAIVLPRVLLEACRFYFEVYIMEIVTGS